MGEPKSVLWIIEEQRVDKTWKPVTIERPYTKESAILDIVASYNHVAIVGHYRAALYQRVDE